MVTMAQRIGELRAERGLSQPALSLALGFPKTAAEKFEAGRQTPSQEQQEKLASFFGVSLPYLHGETSDRTRMSDWMDAGVPDAGEDEPVPVRRAPKSAAKPLGDGETVLDSLLGSRKMQEDLRAAVLDALRSPQGQELLSQAIHRELISMQAAGGSGRK